MHPHDSLGSSPSPGSTPWLGSSPWPLRMSWHDLLFMHWPVDAAALRQALPPGLELDTYGGQAWLGVVPFRMTGVGPRNLNRVPCVSAFLELNVRTYVTAGGRPGVWFYSLDAASRLAVWAARRTFHLPYFFARMSLRQSAGWLEYRSMRAGRSGISGRFAARYRPSGPVQLAPAGSLDDWLTAVLLVLGRSSGPLVARRH